MVSLILGLIIGSFLNVCIYRIPLGRKTGPPSDAELSGQEPEPEIEQVHDAQGQLITISYPPRSFCPNCKEQLAAWHNIPLVSWLLLRGRCYYCKQSISVRYPFVELLSGVSAYLAFSHHDLPTAVVLYAFACALIVISFIDIEYYIIPDKITYPGMILGVLVGIANQYFHIFSPPVVASSIESFFGLLVGGGFLFLVSEVYFRLRKKIGLGFGDVKLMSFMGLVFGPLCAYYAIFLGSIFGSLIGFILIVGGKNSFGRSLPFGPYLALGAYLYLFVPVDWTSLLGL